MFGTQILGEHGSMERVSSAWLTFETAKENPIRKTNSKKSKDGLKARKKKISRGPAMQKFKPGPSDPDLRRTATMRVGKSKFRVVNSAAGGWGSRVPIRLVPPFQPNPGLAFPKTSFIRTALKGGRTVLTEWGKVNLLRDFVLCRRLTLTVAVEDNSSGKYDEAQKGRFSKTSLFNHE